MTPVDRREVQEILRRVRQRYLDDEPSVPVPPAGAGEDGYGVFEDQGSA
jgi:hypothetical protein